MQINQLSKNKKKQKLQQNLLGAIVYFVDYFT